jgi:hypothetical protein
MTRKTFAIIVAALAAMLILASGVSGQEGEYKDAPILAAAVSMDVASSISYQGVLRQNNSPASGSFDMVFTLHDDEACAEAALDTITRSGVVVDNGLFNTNLDVDPAIFTGQALWLKAQVNGVSLGCQEIHPTPYALSVRPEARVQANSGSWGIRIDNAGSGDGVRAYANTTGANWGAIYAVNSGSGSGVYGYSAGGNGVHGIAAGAQGKGVYGLASYSTDSPPYQPAYGGYFEATGPLGTAVYAKASYPGQGLKHAGYFEVDSVTGYAIYAKANGQYTSYAVRGENTGTGGDGGWFSTTGPSTRAVMGYAWAKGGGTANYNMGGDFFAAGDDGIGVRAIADGAYGTGLYASGGQYGRAATFGGKVAVTNASGQAVIELGEGLDYAEGFNIASLELVEPGTVLVIDSQTPGELAVSSKPYDRMVAGIAAGANGLGSAVRLGGDGYDQQVALAGRVYCNVDASPAAVEPGDLLTTSAVKGYAMKVTDPVRAQGAVLGKAMEPLPKGQRGQILVLVTLQ